MKRQPTRTELRNALSAFHTMRQEARFWFDKNRESMARHLECIKERDRLRGLIVKATHSYNCSLRTPLVGEDPVCNCWKKDL